MVIDRGKEEGLVTNASLLIQNSLIIEVLLDIRDLLSKPLEVNDISH